MSAIRIDTSPLRGQGSGKGGESSNGVRSGREKSQRDGRRAAGTRTASSLGARLLALPIRLLRTALALVLVVVASLFLLIRGGVFAYQEWGLGTWPSLLLAVGATVLLLALSVWIASYRLGAGKGLKKFGMRTAGAVGVGYVLYALVFVAGANTKSPQVQAEYTSLHPLLRIATSAVVLFDPGSVITDASRTLDDYLAMGLRPYEESLHFRQADGFVHAVDFRTIGRPEWRNEAREFAFSLLGFATLRHTGTADHLHVALELPGR